MNIPPHSMVVLRADNDRITVLKKGMVGFVRIWDKLTGSYGVQMHSRYEHLDTKVYHMLLPEELKVFCYTQHVQHPDGSGVSRPCQACPNQLTCLANRDTT